VLSVDDFCQCIEHWLGWGVVDRAGEDCDLVMRCWTNAMHPTDPLGVCRATQIIS